MGTYLVLPSPSGLVAKTLTESKVLRKRPPKSGFGTPGGDDGGGPTLDDGGDSTMGSDVPALDERVGEDGARTWVRESDDTPRPVTPVSVLGPPPLRC